MIDVKERAPRSAPILAASKRAPEVSAGSSRQPHEKYGVKLSDDLGSKKTFGWLMPRSMAGQPSSVKRIGLD